MTDAPPSKRRRTEDNDDSETPEAILVRSTEYWFDDGNIILQVESTQFRVAKSMLSMHSTVFRDMFMMPLPTDEPTVENCPVVILTGDTVQDWTHLLGSMYPKRLNEIPSLELVAALLRLGKKYDFSEFRKDCIHRLKMEFPATLKEYDETQAAWWTFVKKEKAIYLPLLSLAKEIGLHSILPLIYCLMITKDMDTYLPNVLDVHDESMSNNDRLAFTLGVVNLLRLQSETTMAWLVPKSHIPCGTCTNSDECLTALKEIIVDMSEVHFPDIWAIDYWNENWGDDLCEDCESTAKEVFQAGRKTCWDKLPSAFGLPDWEKLKSLDLE